jgi:type VI secretion system protein VasD
MVVRAGKAYFLITLVAAFILGGCTTSKPKATDYSIYSEADTLLNRDATARPLSVVLNVYQLRDRQAFARLTFEDFVSGKSDTELLREDLIQKTEIVALPGDKRSLDTQLLPEAAFLGVVAIYRLPAEQQWRYLIPAQQIRKTGMWPFAKEKIVSIRLHDCYMTIDGVQIDLIPGQKIDAVPTCPSQAQSAEASTAVNKAKH